MPRYAAVFACVMGFLYPVVLLAPVKPMMGQVSKFNLEQAWWARFLARLNTLLPEVARAQAAARAARGPQGLGPGDNELNREAERLKNEMDELVKRADSM